MKTIASLIMFGIWALFFIVFLAAFKPDIVTAGPSPTTHGIAARKAPTLLARRSLVFAAASGPMSGCKN
jgi:hypothetical protein